MARKSKYDEYVKPHLADIKKWAASGATTGEIAKALGIAESTLYRYQTEKEELKEAFTRGRVAVCCEIKAALLKKALGFEYTETRQSLKEDEKGSTMYTENYTKYCVPSETAAAMLLRNYDVDWRDNDDISNRFKEQQQRLKEKIAAANNFIDV